MVVASMALAKSSFWVATVKVFMSGCASWCSAPASTWDASSADAAAQPLLYSYRKRRALPAILLATQEPTIPTVLT
jgi:hypothetical protein